MKVRRDAHPAPRLGVYFAADAAAYYRLDVPLQAAGASALAPWDAMTQSQVSGADVAVIARFGAAHGVNLAGLRGVVRALREDAGRVMVDMDDDLFGQPTIYRHPGVNLAAAETAMRAADAVVCTNSTLAGRLRRLNRDVRIVPNYVRATDWPEPAAPIDAPPVIVLAGGYTHQDDWRAVAPALAWARAHHGATVRVCGHLPDYLRPICDDHRPWVDLASYPAMLAGGAIGLCPLPDSGFNRCKSAIKAFEYALSGMAVIGSPCQYGPVLRGAGLGAYVVRDGGDWRAPLGALLTDTTTWRAAADTLRTYVRTTYDAANHAATLRAAYAA